MRRDHLLIVLSVLGINALVITAITIMITRDIRETAVWISIVVLLVVAYLLRRWASSTLLYRRESDQPGRPSEGGSVPDTTMDKSRPASTNRSADDQLDRFAPTYRVNASSAPVNGHRGDHDRR